MDGSTSTGDAVRPTGASDVSAIDLRTGGITLEDRRSIREGLAGFVAAGQLACLAIVILTDLLRGERIGTLSTGIFANSIMPVEETGMN